MGHEYLVTWTMYIDAPNPDAAAFEALNIHRDPGSVATIFTVTDPATDQKWYVDATEPRSTHTL